MSTSILLDEILAMLYKLKDSEEELKTIHNFLLTSIMKEEEEEKLAIPEKFRSLISDIVDNLECGFSTKIDVEKAIVVSVVNENGEEMEFFEEDSEDGNNETDEDIDTKEDDYFGTFMNIDRLESFESFEIMENFANSLDVSPLKSKLLNALQHKKPFANFNAIIHSSTAKEHWFHFRRKALEQYVVDTLTSNSLW
jgi:hypothetical protein